MSDFVKDLDMNVICDKCESIAQWRNDHTGQRLCNKHKDPNNYTVRVITKDMEGILIVP